jgi:hypothetical protein
LPGKKFHLTGSTETSEPGFAEKVISQERKHYHLFTGANKMDYIDSLLDSYVGCHQFVEGLFDAIVQSRYFWFVS